MYVTVGYQQHKPKEWLAFSEEEIKDMDGEYATEFYPVLCKLIKTLKGDE
mgnify:CR=1 FL=1